MPENSSVICDQSNLRAYSIEKCITLPVINALASNQRFLIAAAIAASMHLQARKPTYNINLNTNSYVT